LYRRLRALFYAKLRIEFNNCVNLPVFRIWKRMFFGLLDPHTNPLVKCTDSRIRIRIRIRTKMSRIPNNAAIHDFVNHCHVRLSLASRVGSPDSANLSVLMLFSLLFAALSLNIPVSYPPLSLETNLRIPHGKEIKVAKKNRWAAKCCGTGTGPGTAGTATFCLSNALRFRIQYRNRIWTKVRK
jgi:hypothetical protein